jgi:NAD(P)-dependent dehydrogenase (short-subunit alcohol dehydrogenase family)
MGLELEGKRALVTGASKGVGRGIALELARAGARVAVNYNSDQQGADETAAAIVELGGEAFTVQGNVSRAGDVSRMIEIAVERMGALDILVNNAGVQTWKPLLELSEAEWDHVLGINLKGAFLCTQRAALSMKDTGGGSIINIGSGSNKWPFPNLVDYSASKGGLENFTKVAAVELGKFKIRVNCVAPGAIEIERTKQEAGDYAATWGRLTPLGRIGAPADVGTVVAFLASDKADFVTGQTVWVDGGLFTRPVWPDKYDKN